MAGLKPTSDFDVPGVSIYVLESQAWGGQTQGPVLGWLGLATSQLLVVWAAVAILERVIGQLLHLLSKYLLRVPGTLLAMNKHDPWPHGAYSLGGTDNKHVSYKLHVIVHGNPV